MEKISTFQIRNQLWGLLRNKKQSEWYGLRGWNKIQKNFTDRFQRQFKKILWLHERNSESKKQCNWSAEARRYIDWIRQRSCRRLGNCIQLMFTWEVISNQDNQENNHQELRTTWKDESLTFSVAEVTTKLRKINTDKAAGPDGMHPKLLSSCARAIAEPLSMIYCAFYSSGSYRKIGKQPP